MQAPETYQSLFKWEQTSYPTLDNVSQELNPYQTYFNNLYRWQKSSKAWSDGEFMKLKAETVESELDEMFRSVFNSDWLTLRVTF